MMRTFIRAACACTLALVWTVSPALAQETKKDEPGKKEPGVVEPTKERAAEVREKGRDVITRGSGTDDIRRAQQALKDKGFDPGPIDGQMGPQTKAALGEYQAKEKLKVTGRLDSQTKEQLLSEPAASPRTERSPKQ
jgi:peptidoglycan hydrolase-like protein with peptidoglycan-binding domain